MEKGFINFYDHVRGYGFIRRECGRDVFSSMMIFLILKVVLMYVRGFSLILK